MSWVFNLPIDLFYRCRTKRPQMRQSSHHITHITRESLCSKDLLIKQTAGQSVPHSNRIEQSQSPSPKHNSLCCTPLKGPVNHKYMLTAVKSIFKVAFALPLVLGGTLNQKSTLFLWKKGMQ